MSIRPSRQPKGKPKFQVSGPYRDDKEADRESGRATNKSKGQKEITAIESDEDFERYNLDEWEIEDLDKLPDNRVSGFWKMSKPELLMRALLFIAVVIINEKGWANPHSDQFVLGSWEFRKVTWDPFPPEVPEIEKYEPVTLGGLIEYDEYADNA